MKSVFQIYLLRQVPDTPYFGEFINFATRESNVFKPLCLQALEVCQYNDI